MNAQELNDMFTRARSDFAAECRPEEGGECVACHTTTSRRAQHWNDVGGPNTLSCEACWIESIMCFWVSEEEADEAAAERYLEFKDTENAR